MHVTDNRQMDMRYAIALAKRNVVEEENRREEAHSISATPTDEVGRSFWPPLHRHYLILCFTIP